MLRPIKGIFESQNYPDLLVGLDSPDDAAVWKLDELRSLVVTTDFFTPVVDDPYDYGIVAAANSLSDIYAMGAEPFLALNIAALPPDLPYEISSEILRGGAEKVHESGAVIAGGHTITDKEPKYGLIALGFVHPQKMMTKAGARPGDKLVLTKPLGMGLLTTAIKQGKAAPQDIAEAVGWMSRLNRDSAGAAVEHGVHGATDITGFSLLGHGFEMAEASGVGLRLSYDQIPFLKCLPTYAAMRTFPGGSIENREYYSKHVHFASYLGELEEMLLFDAQTSGGLLLSVPAEKLASFLTRVNELNQPAWEIGEVVEGQGIEVI